MQTQRDPERLNERAWDGIADEYAKKPPARTTALFRRFCMALPPKSHVLDIGAGTGLPFAHHLSTRGFDVLGIDLSSRMVEIARKNVLAARFQQGSMKDLEHEHEFDGIIACYSLLLLDSPSFKDVASRIIRALKPKGLLYLSLNEPKPGDDPEDTRATLFGQVVYSRAYTKKDVLRAFEPRMKLLDFHRATRTSPEFGEEHMMEFLFYKP